MCCYICVHTLTDRFAQEEELARLSRVGPVDVASKRRLMENVGRFIADDVTRPQVTSSVTPTTTATHRERELTGRVRDLERELVKRSIQAKVIARQSADLEKQGE